jgi:hypothetical protein
MSTAETLYYRCIPEFVLLDTELHPYARLLFGIIAVKAHLDTGIVQMTTDHLAELSGLSSRTVLRYLPQLEAKGLIQVARAPRGSKIPNVYEIIGAAAEVVVRKGKSDSEQSTASRQVTERQPGPKRVTGGQSATLNGQGSVGQSSGQTRLPDSPDRRAITPKTATQVVPQVTDRQLTKEQEKQEKNRVLNVVDSEDTSPVFALKGVHPTVMQGWVEQYGINRVQDVIQGLGRQKYVANKGGWMRAALEGGWRVKGSTSVEYVNDAQRYITGEYAAYIDH